MSAFIVADKTINNIVNWLERALDEAYGTTTIRQKLLEQGFDVSESGWTERLGQAMFQLNVNGVDSRYRFGAAAQFRKLGYRFEHTEAVSLVQVLKSLRCWLYQCNEGNVPETALYQLFADDNMTSILMMIAMLVSLYR